jgi:hypothetical protein
MGLFGCDTIIDDASTVSGIDARRCVVISVNDGISTRLKTPGRE